MNTPIYNPPVPYVGSIPSGLQAGHMLRISGTTIPTARCFAINLQCGPSTQPRSDIALHLSPVFVSPPRVVRNSLQNQQWGPEESYGPYFPFTAEQSFEILILVEVDHFKIAINGQHFGEFRYRLPLASISYLAIDGDVTISSITFEGSSIAAVSPEMGYGGGFISPSMPGRSPSPTPPPYSAAPYSPYGLQATTAPYSQAGAPYPQAGAPYPQAGSYPQAGAHYPQAGPVPHPYGVPQGYPMQTGTHVVYPHKKSSPIPIGAGIAAGAAALAGAALAGKSGYGHHKKSNLLPMGGLAAGAAALTGAALLGKSPLKHVVKPKKFKKLYKHKHKFKKGWKGWSSSSSSSSEEE